MPPLNVRRHEPMAAFWYSAFGSIVVSIFIIVFALLLGVMETSLSACAAGDCAIVGPILVLLLLAAVFVLGYRITYYLLFTYELTENSITVNSGILFRKYETVQFDKMQAVDNERNPLLMLFGLTLVKIWTASADQLASGTGKDAARIEPRPDILLLLGRDQAAAVRDFMMRGKSSS